MTQTRKRILAIGLAFALGLAARYALREHATADTFNFLLPWYGYAKAHGWAALSAPFTNYTPLYSYLLIIATAFDGLGQPLSIVKGISAAFEFGLAVLAWRISGRTLAFAAVWLAPTVLFNGAAWGQADSIWAFFCFLSVWLYVRGRNGALAFGAAFATKAQGVFLGPFVLAMMLRRRELLWLASVPAVYLALAVPALLAGLPLGKVLTVYVGQAGTFNQLSMNAANMWAVLEHWLPYAVGVRVGLLIAAAGGFLLVFIVANARRADPQFIVLAASVSLLLTPYLLPKMHDRYFYAFEVAAIVLACMDRRYIAVALAAQISGVLAYLAFDRQLDLVLPATIINTVLVIYMLARLRTMARGGEEEAPQPPDSSRAKRSLAAD